MSHKSQQEKQRERKRNKLLIATLAALYRVLVKTGKASEKCLLFGQLPNPFAAYIKFDLKAKSHLKCFQTMLDHDIDL